MDDPSSTTRAAMTPNGRRLAAGLLALVLTACAGQQPPADGASSVARGHEAQTAEPGRTSVSNRGRYGQRLPSGPAEARNDYAPIMAMLVPGYSFRLLDSDGPPTEHGDYGFVWSIPVMIQAQRWRHSAAISYAEYLESARWTARAVYRLRLLSVPDESALFHILTGVGASYDSLGGLGPRLELDWLLGAMGRGGGLLITAYEYHPELRSHVGELAVSVFIPYVIR